MDVQYSPDIEITGENGSCLKETTIEGDSYFGQCNVDANPIDNLTVHWEYEDTTVHDGALLELKNVRRDQGGVYNCIAENTFWDGTQGYGSDYINIDVQFAKEGESLTLACHVIDANPNDVVFSWNLADGSEYSEAVINIVSVTRALDGNQSCAATNTFHDGSHGTGNEILYLEVQYTSTINMTVHPSHEVNEGTCVSITCTVLDGNPDPYRLK
ncbi:B-cell receptor CD22-like [Ptychodera flava]|uniref:B-cell receptor CD22-like n=1 Tax=Ptychodera flava TaxID=63121 RepID=UPI00396A74BB